jgi:hypothetical protein
MKLLVTRYAAYLTGSDVADAVMTYDLALSRSQKLDVVAVPFMDATDVRREAQFTIGWQTDTSTISQSAHSAGEMVEPELVEWLTAKATALGQFVGRPFDRSEVPTEWPEFE